MTAPVLDLTDRVALITGGSRGVGAAAAHLMARAGARVAVGYRSRAADAAQVCRSIEDAGGRAVALGADLVEEGEAERLFQRAEESLGPVDIFVGNHGVWAPDSVPLARMTALQWAHTIEVNLNSIFRVTREAARRVTDDGRIVLVTSTAAQRGEAGHGDYAASKGAVVSLVKGLAVELAARGVTVNSVAPGWIDTEMARPALQGARLEAAREAIPLGRIASADDVAGPITFLCSPLARHITGEILNVNGGAVRPG